MQFPHKTMLVDIHLFSHMLEVVSSLRTGTIFWKIALSEHDFKKQIQTGFNIFMGPMFLTHGCLFYHASFESTFRINFSISTPAKVALEKNLLVLSKSSNGRMLPLLTEVQYFMNKDLNNSFFFVKSDGKPVPSNQGRIIIVFYYPKAFSELTSMLWWTRENH